MPRLAVAASNGTFFRTGTSASCTLVRGPRTIILIGLCIENVYFRALEYVSERLQKQRTKKVNYRD